MSTSPHTVIDGLDQIHTISLFPSHTLGADGEKFQILRDKMMETDGFTLKWRMCNTACCPGYTSETYGEHSNSTGTNNSWKLRVTSSKTRCFCCCSPEQELIFSDEENGSEEIMKIPYDPEVWFCCRKSKGKKRVIQVYILGQNEPIGNIEYDAKHGLSHSVILSNLWTIEIFRTEIAVDALSGEVCMQVNNASGSRVGVASVTKIDTDTKHDYITYSEYRLGFPVGSLSPTTKLLILALCTMWAVDHREKQYQEYHYNSMMSLIVILFIAGIVALVLVLTK